MLVANIIASPTFSDRFTVRYHNSFASVFPAFTRQVIGNFKQENPVPANVLYIYYNNSLVDDRTIYTDDKNSYSLDR